MQNKPGLREALHKMKGEQAREKALKEQADARKARAKAKVERKQKRKNEKDEMTRELDAQEDPKP